MRTTVGPKVSVIMPVYNGSNYLREAIESVVTQTYGNIEIIIVNDGSTDNGKTRDISKSYSDPRIVYIEKNNGGVASALNRGISAMTGDFFCWLSHDDLFYPDKIARQVGWYSAHPVTGNKHVLYSNYELIDKDGATITFVDLGAQMLSEKPKYAVLRGRIHGCSVFAPKEMFNEIGLFNESLLTTQDYDLWARAIEGGFQFVHLNDTLIKSRWHDEQGSKTLGHRDEADDLWVRLLDMIPDNEKITLEGTLYKYYSRMAAFLEEARAPGAAAIARQRAYQEIKNTKVSVVIPFHKDIKQLTVAINSVLTQTYPNIEIIVVGDSDKHNFSSHFGSYNGRSLIHFVHQRDCGAAAARNAGVQRASGDYVAFLDADDWFLPTKIERQLNYMLENDLSMSHTSYFVSGSGSQKSGFINSGTFKGRTFPHIISSCPIAMPTAMVSRDLASRIQFREDAHWCEDFLFWISVAKEYEIGGIEEPLSVVTINDETVAYNPHKQRTALMRIIGYLEADPDFCAHEEHIALLRAARDGITA